MTKHDIRLRRGRLQSGRIRQHKDYRGLMHQYKKANRQRAAIRFSLLLVFLLVMLSIILNLL